MNQMKTYFLEKNQTTRSSFADYFKKKDTKIISLMSFWAAETFVNLVTIVTLVYTGALFISFLLVLLSLFHTYAVFGTIQEVK